MTNKEAMEIDIERENDIEKLRGLVKYWQEKAVYSEYQLKLIRGLIPDEELKKILNIDKIKEIIKKN